MASILNHLQGLHTNLTKVIQEYPELATEYGHEPRDLASKYGSDHSRSASGTGSFFFRDKLIKDQNDITTKLKSALH